ncbi:MAG: hypothetical protein H6819_00565 [Phycisphaerales bacterium]|nr:hypothetical protein [Phycisphaerales bacterium]MCB9857300.1 hypothetical protein [Phycisphaerales bacterium]MCB9862986.1 hypothetical protein [Phycisphaerales bacterium]
MRRTSHPSAAILILLSLCCAVSCDSGSSKNQGASATGGSAQSSNSSRGRYAPLSEYAGTIDHIVVHQPEALVGQAWQATHDLLKALPNSTFTLVCNSPKAVEEVTGRLRQWKFTNRGNIRLMPVDGPLLMWARDRYIATRRSASEALPVWLTPEPPPTFDAARRGNERGIPDAFNEIEPTCKRVDSSLVLEGGNVVASQTIIYIGANVFRENASAGDTMRVRSLLEDLFAGKLIVVGDDGGNVPCDHVDMYLTAIDDNKVLLGSPALARKVIAAADEASKQALYERLYITPNMPPPVGPDFTPQRIKLLDDIAARLTSEGVEVIRIPYADSRGGDFIVTYNNVLQESRDGERIVIMPVYGIPALDAAARGVYESLGMTVREVNVSTISHLVGAVRCMANVVGRN